MTGMDETAQAAGEVGARLSARIEGYRQEMVQFQKALTAVVALGPENGGDGEWERAEFVATTATRFGLPAPERFDAPDARVSSALRPNLVFRLRGRRSEPATWVLAHMDTVPPGERRLWDSDPFVAEVRDGRIVGRGVEDNQQGLTAALFALRALVDEGLAPAGDACVMLVADEETGNRYGLEHVLDAAPDLIGNRDLMIVPDAGSPDGASIEIAEKSTLWVEFTVHGRQVHASIPDAGVNAHRAAAHLTVRLDQRLPAAFPRTDALYDLPRSTFEPTRHDANVPNVNTVPGEEHLFFDCRVLPSYSLGEVKAVVEGVAREVEAEFACAIDVAYPVTMAAAPPTTADAPVVRVLSAALHGARGVDSRLLGIGGGTVAAVLRRRGIPAAVWATLEEAAHSPNEYCVIDNLVADALVLAYVFAAGCEEGVAG